MTLPHGYPFDPTYGYDLPGLLAVVPPEPPEDFATFWQARHARAMRVDPAPRLDGARRDHPHWEIHDLTYRSTDDQAIGGWLLVPRGAPARRAVVVGHGYAGREAPDFDLPLPDTVILFPCVRGLGRSRRPDLSEHPWEHVVHGIEDPERYIHGGCVDDLWLAFVVLETLYPELAGHFGYLGISLCGGLGALAAPWEARIRLVHLNVPSLGHQGLRLKLPTTGSAAGVQAYVACHGHVPDTLAYYDAACAARFLGVPAHLAVALFDPVVPPPGQFAIHNAIAGEKRLAVLAAGHFDYPEKAQEEARLRQDIAAFFSAL